MKARLLFPDADFGSGGAPPTGSDDLIADLELTTLLATMAAGDKFLHDVAARVLLTSLTDPDAIRYRQAVLADCIAQPGIIRELYNIAVGALADKRGVWGFLGSQNPSSILSGAVSQLEVQIVRLRQLRRFADDHSGKFSSDGLTTFLRTVRAELDDDYFATLGRHLKQLRFPGGQLISAELDRDNSGISYMLRSGSARLRLRERIGIAPRTVHSFSVHPRDDAGAQALEAITGRAINHVANAAAQSADHISNFFAMLRAELAFYLGCLNLRGELEARGQPVTFPGPSPPGTCELACADLRDPCLALRTSHAVGNDVDADGAPLMVITGANSGGKSTFLRSLGVAQLMMQAGMFVTAKAFRASVCHGVFTHFIREEDPAMVSGRLDEELARMSAIAGQISQGCLVLFNESFAATNEREGSEIGRQVVTALLEAGIRVVFVTHHFDLADSLHRQDEHPALFLRAPRQPDGRRDFKLVVAEPLPTSYGADIYHRIGGWLGESDDSQAQTGNGDRLTRERAD
jgi:MutS-like protein